MVRGDGSSEERAPAGVKTGGQYAATARPEADKVRLNGAFPPGEHVSVVTTPQTLDAYCAECGDSMRVPNKGLGRASVAAWKTRHQHLDDAETTSGS